MKPALLVGKVAAATVWANNMSHPPQLSKPLYGLVAWPPEVLDTWMKSIQERLNVRAFGLPHINLRAPFQTSLSQPELLAAVREMLRQEPCFEVKIKGWKRVKGIIFLQCELDTKLSQLHCRALAIGPSSHAPYDGNLYQPHLTLALGILPWAEDIVWAEVISLISPISSFSVEAISLTLEHRGEVQELHTFPLVEVQDTGIKQVVLYQL